MPSFYYKAKKSSAETVTGVITAQNQDEAVDLISRTGLLPVVVEEKTSQGRFVSDIKTRAVKPNEVYAFTRQLVSLIKSGVSIIDALEVINRKTSNPYFSKVIADIVFGIKNGRSFSASLEDFPKIFPSFYIQMIHAGQESGHLKDVLLNISQHLKKQQDFTAKIKSAIVYPLFMLLVGTATVFFILTFVMPKISTLFQEMSQTLPWPTLVVLAVSHFCQRFGSWLVFIGLIFVLIAQRFFKTPQGQKKISEWIISTPYLKDIFVKIDLVRFSQTFQLLLESGLPIVRALEIAAPTIYNPILRKQMESVRQEVQAGESLGLSLHEAPLVPDLMAHLIGVGEEAGTLNEALSDIVESYESDLNEITKSVTTLLEPLLILLVGGIVGFIVFAMLLPIFQMDIFAR